MPTFSSDGVAISYYVHGQGDPVLLLHGACVNFSFNYRQTGWVDTLTNRGYQVIGLDFRGHGASEKSTDPAFYGTEAFSKDVMNLLHRLNLKTVALMSYSMGTVVGLNLLHQHPEYFSKAVLIGTGEVLIGEPPFEKIVQGLSSLLDFETFPAHLPKHVSAYWSFFKELGLDRKAIKAFSQATFPTLSTEEVAAIEVPTLIISGDNDLVLGQGRKAAKTLANGHYVEIQNTDHFTLAIAPDAHRQAVDFLMGNESR